MGGIILSIAIAIALGILAVSNFNQAKYKLACVYSLLLGMQLSVFAMKLFEMIGGR